MTAIFERGFRPFFLLAAIQAALFVPLWIAVMDGWIAAPAWLGPAIWHAHEMLFGFCAAAMAGFLLTAVPVWTDTLPITGRPLALLAALWLAGRVAMLVADRAPLATAVIDFAFLPALAAAVAPAILHARSRRNFGFPLVLLALACANAFVHADALGLGTGHAATGVRAAVDLVVLLVIVIGGRIVPGFTTNALRRAGSPDEARAPGWAERSAIPVYLLFAAVDVGWPASRWSGAAAALAALVLAVRLSGWRSLRVLGDPLLGSLHVGYAWVVIGLAGLAGSDLSGLWPRSVAVHAMTAGAFGTMILAVMTRVALGHTGRPLEAPPSAVFGYVFVTAAALLRTVGVAAFPELPLLVVTLAGAFWSAAFLAFLAGYARLLGQPRVDGRPG